MSAFQWGYDSVLEHSGISSYSITHCTRLFQDHCLPYISHRPVMCSNVLRSYSRSNSRSQGSHFPQREAINYPDYTVEATGVSVAKSIAPGQAGKEETRSKHPVP